VDIIGIKPTLATTIPISRKWMQSRVGPIPMEPKKIIFKLCNIVRRICGRRVSFLLHPIKAIFGLLMKLINKKI
jgi:hypothetical protein